MIAVRWIDLAELFDRLANNTAHDQPEIAARFRQAAQDARHMHEKAMERGDYE